MHLSDLTNRKRVSVLLAFVMCLSIVPGLAIASPVEALAGPYTVTFADGFGGIVETQSVPEGGFATTPTPDPTRPGYTFAGWSGWPSSAIESLRTGWVDPISYWTYFGSDPVVYVTDQGPIVIPGGSQTVNADDSVTFSIETTSVYADGGMRWWIGRLGDLPDFVLPGTGSPFYVNMRFDNKTPGAFDGIAAAGHFTEEQILAGTALHSNYNFGPLVIEGATIFGQYMDDAPYGPYTLADFRNGNFTATGPYSAITPDTLVRINVGIGTMTGAAQSATVSAPEFLPVSFPTTPISADTTFTAMWTRNSAINVIRFAGNNRYATAALAALHDFPAGADTAIVAFSGGFPDALSASGLAGAANAPILLTDTNTLNASTAQAIDTLGVTKVYIVGGPAVVGDGVRAALLKVGAVTEVERLGGPNRYDTSALIADEVVSISRNSSAVFVVRGDLFADALSASSIATQMEMPVLLTPSTKLAGPASAFIVRADVDNIYIAGGTSAVSSDVEKALAALTTTVRWSGANRYATGATIIRNSVATFGAGTDYIGIASGTNFPDALVGGAALGARNGVLLLTAPTALSADTLSVIMTFKTSVLEVQILGGPSAIAPAVETSVRAALL